jgi:DNA-binding HxlR family transcriptional regulator
VFLADCPARTTLSLIADTWSVVVIVGLGTTLCEPVRALSRWAEQNADALLDAQARP